MATAKRPALVEPRQDRAGLSVASSTIAVMSATLVSMLLGFGREMVNARYFGERWELDSFLVAAIIPTLVFGVFNGALVSALVPVLSGYFAADESEEAWRLSSTVINMLLIVLSLCAIVGWFAAPYIVALFGFPPGQSGQTTHMTQIMMPTIIATSIAGVVQALLNAQQRFKAAALQGMALNVCAIAGVLWLFPRYGIYALVFGTAAGAVAQLLVQLPSYFRRCVYRPIIDFEHPGLRSLFVILGPIVVGSAVGQANLLFDKYFAASLPNGAIAAMQYATKVVGFPQQLFAAAIATVIFPILSAQFASKELPSLRLTASTGLRMTALITLPAALGLIVLAQPVISVLFERGEFTYGDLVRTAGAMQFYAVGLLGLAASIVLTRCFFAMRDSRTPVIVASSVMVLNVVCSALLVRPFGVNGLASANSLASLAEAAVLYGILRTRVGASDGEAIGASVWRVVVASGAMAVVAYALNGILWHDAGTIWQHVATLSVDIVAAGATFLAAGTLLRVKELAQLLAMMADYVGRRAASAARQGKI
jgi:putative peptidoglycan lipid II flippase